MRVSAAILAEYRKILDELGEQAGDRVSAAIAYTSGMRVTPVRDAAIEALSDVAAVEGDMAQVLAAQLYDEVCASEGIDTEPARLYEDVIDEGWIAEKVHWHARALIEGNRARFEGECRKLADFYVKRCAYENTVRNCDANRVRYARVPSGNETCAWCLMLASRGFVYHSEESASHGRHVGCDCVVLPGVPGKTKVDGYDEEGMRRRWAMCQQAAGVEDGDTWKNRKKILKEAATRDSEWLLTGTCRITRVAANSRAAYEKTAHPDAYADWQDAVSQIRRLGNHPNLTMHIKDTKPWKNVTSQGNRPLSYYEVPGDNDYARTDALRHALDGLAGTGYPDISDSGKWKSTEIVAGVPYNGYDALAGDRKANAAKIHYSVGRRKLVHIVPQFNRSVVA